MSLYVVDASIAAKWFTEEPFSETALTLLDERNRLHVPDFFMLEMDSVVCKWIRKGIIRKAEGDEVRATLRQLPFQNHSFEMLQESAYSLAVQTGLTIYDCLYVSLAIVLNGKLVTADRQLYEGMTPGPFARHLVWIADVV